MTRGLEFSRETVYNTEREFLLFLTIRFSFIPLGQRIFTKIQFKIERKSEIKIKEINR